MNNSITNDNFVMSPNHIDIISTAQNSNITNAGTCIIQTSLPFQDITAVLPIIGQSNESHKAQARVKEVIKNRKLSIKGPRLKLGD